jgi:3',5'-cyclic AMP phosphodiesterase CpdA
VSRVRLHLLGLVVVALAAATAAWPLTAKSDQTPAPAPGAAPAGARGQGPQTVPPGGFVFVQLSDPQFGFSNSDRDFIQDTANAEFAVASVNRLKPAFVIVTGDLVNKPGDAAQIAEYRRIIAKVDPSVPVYSVAGNHDIENEPTAATLAAYRSAIGKDYYTFRSGSLLGIVLNSTMIVAPQHVEAEYAAQDRWLRGELAKAPSSGARHVVIFQHHPWFLDKAEEADQYFNVPLARRTPLLSLFRSAGITTLVSGHLHRSVEATDAGLTSIVTGPVGRPLGGQSGLRIFAVSDAGLSSRYYSFGELPYAITAPVPGRGRE